MTQPYKQCPQCGTVAQLQAQVCASCGRQYKTTFNVNQTQFVPAQPMAFTGTGVATSVQGASMLAEMERQYKSLRLQQLFFMCFVWWFFFVGIFLALYYNTRIDAVRTNVARTGTYVADWEEPLLQWFWRMFGAFVCGALLLYILVVVGFVSYARAVFQPPSPQPGQFSFSRPAERSSAPAMADTPESRSVEVPSGQSDIRWGDGPPITNPQLPPDRAAAPPRRQSRIMYSSPGSYRAAPSDPVIVDHGSGFGQSQESSGGFSGARPAQRSGGGAFGEPQGFGGGGGNSEEGRRRGFGL